MSEDNKARVRHYFEETLSKGNMTYVDEIDEGSMAESLKLGASGTRSALPICTSKCRTNSSRVKKS